MTLTLIPQRVSSHVKWFCGDNFLGVSRAKIAWGIEGQQKKKKRRLTYVLAGRSSKEAEECYIPETKQRSRMFIQEWPLARRRFPKRCKLILHVTLIIQRPLTSAVTSLGHTSTNPLSNKNEYFTFMIPRSNSKLPCTRTFQREAAFTKPTTK